MSLDDLIADLRVQVETGKCIVVTGAGTSILATGNDPRASWLGLLEDGAEEAALGDAYWLQRAKERLKAGAVEQLFPVADEIVARLKGHGTNQARYRRWLKQSVGNLVRKEPEILQRVLALGLPIITTNYDSLLEDERGDRRYVNWSDFAKVQRVLRGDDHSIIHLHGHWDDPDSVLLNMESYWRKQDHPMAELQRSSALLKSLIFVGVGQGLRDPDFAPFLEWVSQITKDTGYTHYRLCRTSELEFLQEQHRYHNIELVPYGEKFEQLSGFLALLEPAKLTPVVNTPAEPRPRGRFEDLDKALINRYAASQNVGIDGSLDGNDKLKKLRLIDDDGELFDRALLCFAKEPSVFYPGAEVKLIDTRTRHVHNIAVPLPEQVSECLRALRTLVNMSQLDEEGREVFFEAVREAVSNAIVHRDYHVPEATKVLFGGDVLEVQSPGRLPPSIDRSAVLLGRSQPPHPHRARLLHYLGAAEGAGLGFHAFRTLKANLGAEIPGADVSVREEQGLVVTTLTVPRRASREEVAGSGARAYASNAEVRSIADSQQERKLERGVVPAANDGAGRRQEDNVVRSPGLAVRDADPLAEKTDSGRQNSDGRKESSRHEAGPARASEKASTDSPGVRRGRASGEGLLEVPTPLEANSEASVHELSNEVPERESAVGLQLSHSLVRTEIGPPSAGGVPTISYFRPGSSGINWGIWLESLKERCRGLGAKDVLVSPKPVTVNDAPKGWARAQRDGSQRSLAEVLATRPLRAVIIVGPINPDNLLAVVLDGLLGHDLPIALIGDKDIDEDRLHLTAIEDAQVLPVVWTDEPVRAYYPVSEQSDQFVILTGHMETIPFGLEADLWQFNRIREDALFRLLNPRARGELAADPSATAVLKRLVLTPSDVDSVNKAVKKLGEGPSMVQMLTSIEGRSSWLGLDVPKLRSIVRFAYPWVFPTSANAIDLTGRAIDRWLRSHERRYTVASLTWSVGLTLFSTALLVLWVNLAVLDAVIGGAWLLCSTAAGLLTRARVGVSYGRFLLSIIPVAIVEIGLSALLVTAAGKPLGLVLWALGFSVVAYMITQIVSVSKRDSRLAALRSGAFYADVVDAEDVLTSAEKLRIVIKRPIEKEHKTPKGRVITGLKQQYLITNKSIFRWLSQEV